MLANSRRAALAIHSATGTPFLGWRQFGDCHGAGVDLHGHGATSCHERTILLSVLLVSQLRGKDA